MDFFGSDDSGRDGSNNNTKSTTGDDGDTATALQIMKLVAWMFIPRFVADFILSRYYSWKYRSSSQHLRPQPGSARYQTHFARVYVALILLYLLYSLAEVYYLLPQNYFDLFGISPRNFDQRAVKQKWRQISLEHHPDKTLNSADGGAAALDKFLEYRRAVEVLQNPLHRWAYGKFGGTVFEDCANCLKESEYIYAGLSTTTGFYLGTGIVVVILSFVGGKGARFWRWAGFAALAIVELNFLLRHEDFLPWIYPSRTVSEKIKIMHQLYWAFTVGLSQIGPFLAPTVTHTEKELRELVNELADVNEQATAESALQYAQTFRPFHDASTHPLLQNVVEQRTVDAVLHREKGLAHARRVALQQRA